MVALFDLTLHGQGMNLRKFYMQAPLIIMLLLPFVVLWLLWLTGVL